MRLECVNTIQVPHGRNKQQVLWITLTKFLVTLKGK